MPTKQPPRVMFNFEKEEIPEQNVDESIHESILDDEVDTVEPVSGITDRLPDVEKKPIVTEDIFEFNTNLAVLPDTVKEDLDQDYMEQGTTMDREHEHQKAIIESATPKPKRTKKVTLNKDGRPRKAMTPEHKAKLAEARKKAQEGRRLAKQRRDEEREFKRQETELLKKKKKQDFEKLKKEVEEPTTPAPAPAPVQRGLTQADLQEAQYQAIIRYDALRKQQKAEKKKKQEEEKAKQELMAKIMPRQTGYRAKDANGRYLNPWDSCY